MHILFKFLVILPFVSVEVLHAQTHISHEERSDYELALTRIGSLHKLTISKFSDPNSSSQTMPFTDSSDPMVQKIATEFLDIPLKVPCRAEDLKKANGPTVHLIGEFHTCPNCALEFTKRLLDARSGRTVLASEGIDGRRNIEEVASQDFPELLSKLRSNGRKVVGLENGRQWFSNFAEQSLSLSNVKSVKELGLVDWKTVKAGKPEARETANIMIAIFDLFSSDYSELAEQAMNELAKEDPQFRTEFFDIFISYKERIRNKQRRHSTVSTDFILAETETFIHSISPDRLGNAFRRILARTLNIMTRDRDIAPSIPPTLLRLMQQPDLSRDDLQRIDDVFTMTVRSRDFAANILELYCQESKGLERPIFTRMGLAHLGGVRYFVQTALASRGIKANIRIQNDAVRFNELSQAERREHIDASLKSIEERLKKLAPASTK